MNQIVKTKRRYLSRKRRNDLLERFGASYVVAHDNENGCVYCGQDCKGGQDHVPPLSVAAWYRPKGPRYLYAACGLCNIKLSAFPLACLVERAEYLLCVLRREWLVIRSGQPRRWTAEQVAAKGVGVKARLATAEIRARCRCASCACATPAAKPELLILKNPLPYAGQEFGKGVFPAWDMYDEGGTTGI